MARDILMAKQAFWARVDGVKTLVPGGATMRADHQIARQYPDLFEPFRVQFDTVEQATAAPGERRELPVPEPKKSPGRPKLPRDAEGNIIRE